MPRTPLPALAAPLLAFGLASVLAACQPASDAAGPRASQADTAVAGAGPDAGPSGTGAPVATAWPLPVAGRAAQPDLVATPDGRLLLSWIETADAGHALRLAAYTPATGVWDPPHTVARGDDWFVNWADTPHVLATPDGALWAHWLRKSAAAAYAYDVVLVRSGDGGASWSAPVAVNDDGTPTEHGFVSLWADGHDRLGVAWLDGRETGADGHDGYAGDGGAAAGVGDAGGDPPGAMTLRAAVFDGVLARSGETVVDAAVCDCCQTAVAATARGPLLVYRDRAAGEVRDIAASRLEAGRWSQGRQVHADGWVMPACPVNGPAVAAQGSSVVVAWYTAAGGQPQVRLARSDDAGERFAAPLTVDSGPAVQGRVAVALGGDSVWMLWLREEGGTQSLQLARHAPDLSRELQRTEIGRLQGRGRGTGFPQLVLAGDAAHVVWTDVVDGVPVLRGAVLDAAAGR